MANDLNKMNGLDIYLSNISKEEYDTVTSKIGHSTLTQIPLMGWGLFMEGFNQRQITVVKNQEKAQVLSFANKFKWQNDMETVFNKNDYEALIITDLNQKIIWVNDGFPTMTGYSKAYAINNTPRFLQGKETSEKTKNRIKQKIALGKPFKEIIVNHKKDHTSYKSEVKIFPLYNEKTTHFIAFEKQVV